MKVFVLIKDETDFNGDRHVFGVYSTYDAAKTAGDWEIEKIEDWVRTMVEAGATVGNWIPRFTIEETTFYS